MTDQTKKKTLFRPLMIMIFSVDLVWYKTQHLHFKLFYIYQFGWLSERWGNFLNLLQKEGVPKKGGFLQKRGGSNPGGNYDLFLDFYTILYHGIVKMIAGVEIPIFYDVGHFCRNFLNFIFKNIFCNNNLGGFGKLICTCLLVHV